MKNLKPLSDFIVEKGLQTGPFGSQLKAEEYTLTGIPVVMPKDISSGYIQEESIVRIPSPKAATLKKHSLQEGDILFPRRGDLGRIGIATTKNVGWICGTGCLRARLKTSVLPEYMHQYLLLPEIKQWLENNALGQTMLNLNTEIIAQLPVYVPSLDEQTKIASILTDTDHAIETTERLIVAKERYFDGLLQKLLSYLNSKQAEISLQSITIGDILKEFSRKTTINNQHILLSVTKNGIYAQDEHFNKQIASSNNIGYKIIQRDNVVFSTMNLWMGSLDILKQYDVGIVSPAYKTFEINTSLANIDFIQFFLKSPYMLNLYDLYSGQGASIVRRNLDLQGLLASTIKIPSLEHQAKIAEVLNTAKREIDLLKKLAESYRLQKRGLMQKLLNGEWRVSA